MLISTHYAISPFSFDPPGGLEFEDTDLLIEDRKFRLTIRTRHWEDETSEPFTDILIVALSERSPSEDVELAFMDPARFKGTSPAKPDLDRIFKTPTTRFPQSYWRFLEEAGKLLDSEANRLFGIIRWRAGIRGGPSEFRSRRDRLKWRTGDWRSVDTDPGSWKTLPHGLLISVEDSPFQVRLTVSQKSSILDLAPFGEPLGQDLLQEAWRLIDSNPRSALVTCISAVETRLKELIADLIPSTSWLLENLPSPPMDKIIRYYIEQLPARCKFDGRVFRPNKQIITKINWGILQRNKLVHGRGGDLDPAEVRELLDSSRTLLYLLDYYAGQDWAKEHLDPSAWEE